MMNNFEVHQVKLQKPIESKILFYFENKHPQVNANAKLLSYDLESAKFSFHGNIALRAWIFILPKGDSLLVLERYKGGENLILFQFLNKQNYKASLILRRSLYRIIYCDGYIYILGYNNSRRCRVIDELGNAIKHFKWIKMPNLIYNSPHEYFSCIKYYDKFLITETYWDSLYLYDEIVNSYSQLPVILRTGCKILSVHELKIYIITFSGPIYVNVKGNLAIWNILSLNFFDFDLHTIVSSVYYGNNFYIANNGNFYKFDFGKENLEKIES
ncbi:unnamed protein product [Blepharisma stoltei]|uniref:Uncharacterized protein n=1 Tax=Blepharisma stoltei TaxID=1481888 RepID=A0AAU9KAN3_9CILI|nr:unnamed protein product [Blepharisma stoltei]